MRRLLSLSWPDRALLAEAVVWLALGRLAVKFLPFRVLSRRLGTQASVSPSAGAGRELTRVGWAIAAAAARVPWRAKCLEQALAAKAMLRARHVPNTLYLGVARDAVGDEGVVAHAWVRSGTVHVTGGTDVERYGVVLTFADLPQEVAQPAG